MKAAVLRGKKDIRIESVPDPVADPDGIIVKVKACGVCGSDLHVYKAEGNEGTIFGHEFSGEVAEVGAKVSDITVGERVTAVGFRPCGECFWCKQGKGFRCSALALVGYQLPGAMAEYVAVPSAVKGRNVFPLPEELTFEDAATVEPLSISLYSVKKAQPREKDIVAVMGAGVIGLSAIQILKSMGVSKVLVSARRPSRLQAARESGSDLVIDAATQDTVAEIMAATGDMGVDIVVECAGSPISFDQSIEILRGGGKMMLVGIYETPLSWDPANVINKNISLIGCLGGNFPGSIDLLKTGKVTTRNFVTHRFPLDKTAEAFETQISDPGAIKVMIIP
ncbi:MAG: alcohol dehydrogenase catalytic domain-containing protein [Syntrophales bacterium]|jgi:2-desacetyl-2-hydroxyethyl bacteriochlorophyllide A dehydrogenase|nr:alcohol dehydrogenase catalytic domain-containing protein [Syntrophales bacterium]MDY0044367.1 alcohol dehydrogenase catalytic domain-containing protein [Syntrophales bacterium]